MEIYKIEMSMSDIPIARQFSSFARVIVLCLHSQNLEIQVASPDWETFEQNLLEEYSFNDSS